MWKSIIRIVCLSAVLGCASGCFEYGSLIDLKKDGSGTITMRLFMSDQMATGMGAMEAAITEMAGQEASVDAGVETSSAMLNGIRQSLVSAATNMGEGVTFVSSREMKNRAGWPGIQAEFAFEDINTVQIREFKMEDAHQEGSTSTSSSFGGKQEYGFRFTPGDRAVVEVLSLSEPTPKAEDAAAEQDASADAMGGAMLQMMGPMLKGMRMSLLLRVNGEIIETDAAHQPPNAKHNAVILYDLEVDRMLADPSVASYLSDDSWLETAEQAGVPGVRVHDVGRTIRVEFE